MASRQDVVALRRFGLGPRPGDLARIGDARAALIAEVEARRLPPVAGLALTTPAEIAAAFYAFLDAQRAARRVASAPQTQAPEAPPAMQTPDALQPPPALQTPQQAEPPLPQRVFRDEATARVAVALESGVGFGERLAMFWSNHFCISVAKGQFLRAQAGLFEREAIRPHVFGRFEDMLVAVASHPAMLAYLDNAQSIGPNSPAGARRGRGLNENLAREILELHTLGVRGGYTQADVAEFARILTGWTIAGPEGRLGAPGGFVFNPRAHEPGARRLLGATYPEGGLEQGRAALAALARHPATAAHVAAKLVRAFVGDAPAPALVSRLAATFRETQGDLAALALILVRSDEAWNAPATRLSTPQEFYLAAARALGRRPGFGQIAQPLAAMGQPLWQPPGPDGFSLSSAIWTTPEGVKARVEFAAAIGRLGAAGVDPRALAEEALGPLLSAETRQAVARAESRPQAIALLLMAPEFQRR
ncbi:MAG: DUF1800 family protein [Methylobacteriaceae bacterium]|nr:DUF1800 family protein [Methylobacteriaceae bacterium]